MQIYGLVGHPVRHSLSPAMQNAAFSRLGIRAKYNLYDIVPEGLEDFLDKAFERDNISGLNITIPHKISAKLYLERNGSLDDNAIRIGAVNTIKAGEAGGRLRGYNTDGPGFYRSLVEDLKFEPEGRQVFVLGAGGAARAVVMYLADGPRMISIFDMDGRKAEELKAHYEKYYDAGKLAVVGHKEFKDALSESDLLVNATPVGMKASDPSPIDKKFLHAGLYVYDLVYNRQMTELVKDAGQAKCHAATGLGMLLYQGAISFEIWTGKSAPIAVMRKALKEALKSK